MALVYRVKKVVFNQIFCRKKKKLKIDLYHANNLKILVVYGYAFRASQAQALTCPPSLVK